MLTQTVEPPSAEAPYELIVVDKLARQIHRKRFDNVKDAIAFVTPAIFLDHQREYFVVNHYKSSSHFIKLNKSTNESYTYFRVLQNRSNDRQVFHSKSTRVTARSLSEILRASAEL